MKKFTWRLQRVLDLKESEEQLKKAELNNITQQIARGHSRLMTLNLKLKKLLNDLSCKNMQDRMNEHELVMRYSANNDAAIKVIKQSIHELEEQQKIKMEELLELRRFKEGLSRLREKARMEYIKEQEKLEQNEMDDRTTVRYARENIQKINISHGA